VSGDLLARLQATWSDQEREWIALQFSLDSVEPSVREAVWAAAIPHWFNGELLATLLDKPNFGSGPDFRSLIALSFVEPFPGRGYNVHERTRALLLKQLWQHHYEKYRALSRHATDYCAQQDQSETLWRVETLYHLLIAEPDEGASQLQNVGWEWHNPPNFAYSKVEALARASREHADAGRLSERGLGWTAFWEARLDSDYSRFQSAKERFLQIRITSDADPYLAAEVSLRLGDVHRMLGEYEQARTRYEMALPIYQQLGARTSEANCIRALGDLYYALIEYEQAQARYEEVLPIYRQISNRLGEANCIKSLGNVHRMIGNYNQARVRYEEALTIYRQIGDRLGEANCIWGLGELHRMLDRYNEAQTRYEEALSFFRQIRNRQGEMICLQGLGDLDRQRSQWTAATQKYQQALDYYQSAGIASNIAVTLWRLGHAAKGAGNVAQAREYYQSSLDILGQLGIPAAEEVRADLDSLPAESGGS